MVREILTVQMGQCGNNIGNVFWETLLEEHRLDLNGAYIENDNKSNDNDKNKTTYLDKIDVFFSQQSENLRYVPRSIFVDLDPSIIDSIKASKTGKLYKTDNFIFGNNSAANNYAKGRYTEGADVEDEIMDVIRRECEDCDCLQSIQMTHSVGGGTGSGLGSLILQDLRDYYKDRIICAYTIFPSQNTSQIVVEDYNAILALNEMVSNIDESFIMDNHSLFNICDKIHLGNDLRDLNWLISLAMSGITSSLRFPGQLNGDLRKLGVNLVPFPRLHFFTIAQFPLLAREDKNDNTKDGKNKIIKTNLTIRDLTQGIMKRENYYVEIAKESGRCLAASILYRGEKDKLSTFEVENEISQTQDKFWEDFVDWIPFNIKTSVINVPTKGYDLTSTFVSNHTGIVGSYKRIISNVKKLLKKKAFLHRYKEEGLDELDIVESINNIKDLINEYQDKQNIDIYSPDNVVDIENADGFPDFFGGDDEV